MEQITGRLTDNAEVKTTKDNRKLVAFTLVINHSFKKKGADKPEKRAVFFNCAYWLSTEVAKLLRKGSIVTLFGHIDLNEYKTKEGEFRANLAFHVNTIEFIAKAKDGNAQDTTNEGGNNSTTKDDLPF